ncbi:MAG: hypothetical protein KF763_20795 [Cyclobacteriaceae bacterium]|nr:hypothetical protein [Cyclobacteriaceae bacterium]
MSIKETFEKKGTWELVYVVGFYIPIYLTISDIVENSVERIPLTIIGLIVSVGLGLGIYHLVRTKTHLRKTIVIITGFLTIVLFSISFQSYSKRLTYDTCEICGFVSVDRKTFECQMCVEKKWDSSIMTGYTDKNQYIKEEQLFWFRTESKTEKVNFYLPEGERNEDNYPKDKNWRPIVTEAEVIEYSQKDWRE